MTRQIRIVHHTGYSYAGLIGASHNEVRMTPRVTREQYLVSSRIEIEPMPWLLSFIDYWGTRVTAFEIRDPHRRLDVTSRSTVEITRSNDPVVGVSWDELRFPAFADLNSELLQMGAHTEPGPDLRAIAETAARSCPRPAQAIEQIVAQIRDRIRYEPGSTHVRTRAVDAWEARAGVCQDMVHLAIGGLRSIGIPCRYVSGYVMPSSDPIIGEARTGESHAWLQYWDGDWVGLDPTNDTAPGEFHVEVGLGRDYTDVPPLRGVYAGGGQSEMYVEVEMTVLA